LSFILKKKTYAINETLIIEREGGDNLFFIVSGKVSLLHKRTKTHIKDLEKDDHFGEIAFFSETHRMCSAKARNFSDVLTI
jgi:CRP-like cAMP-binding protein